MKRLLLTLLCLAGVGSHSQDYIPLLNDNSWYVHFYGFLTDHDAQWTLPVGDITINDTIYTHYQESYSLNQNLPPTQNNYYIREDIEEKRVYTRINNEEHLLYDFSLEVGDEVSTLVDGEWSYTFTVVAKDSFAVDTGRKRVRLFLEETGGYPVWEEWIEGLGSRDHPLKNFELLIPDGNYEVLCNHYGDEMPYSVNEYLGEPFTCPEPPGEPEDDYIPLVNHNSWYIMVADMDFADSYWLHQTGNETIEGKSYTKYNEVINQNNNIIHDNDYLVREDVEAQRVYKWSNVSGEHLLYDFSLEEGDDIMLYMGEEVPFTVVAKDSFAVETGRKRVRIVLESDSYPDGQEIWIEGMGNLGHPLIGFHQFTPDPEFGVRCNYYDGQLAYTWNTNQQCPEPPLTNASFSAASLKLYPNPFSNSFILTSDEPLENATLTLHDITGRLIRKQTFSGSEIEVPRDYLPDGIYMLRIWQEGRPVLSQKLVAE
jgi:hypothetical protein